MPLYMAKPIIPTSLTTRTMNANFLNALLRIKKNVQLDYSATVATWKEHHPTFKVYVKYAGGNAVVLGGTAGQSFDNRVWNWLDKGTARRFAVMSDPFHAKTRYRNIGSVEGVGHMVYVSKKLSRHGGRKPGLKGISKREFTYAIRVNNYRTMIKLIDQAVKKSMASGKGVYRPGKEPVPDLTIIINL